MAINPKTSPTEGLQIDALKRGRITLRLIGETPLFFNAMSAKAQRTLLLGGGKKTTAERKELKHDPYAEFRDSIYSTDEGPTLLVFPAPAIKGAMATAALETPGVKKSEVQRLVFLPEAQIKIWGKPQLRCDVVRSADMNRTPDVRTRAFLPRWAASVDIAYTMPALDAHAVVSLLANAGLIVGIGDFRQEKGRGSFGTFSVHGDDMDEDDAKRWAELQKEGRVVQERAMKHPEAADENTRQLLEMLDAERKRRDP